MSSQPRTAPAAACPLCGGEDNRHMFAIPDRLHEVPGTYTYVRCASCGTVHQSPRVVSDDLPLCYPADYFTHLTMGAAPAFRTSVAWDRLRALILERNDRPLGLRSAGTALLRSVPGLAARARLGLPSPIGMPSAPGDKALEVGPGRGLDLVRLKRLGWDPVGLEVDPEAAREASRVANCPVLVGDLVSLPSLTQAEFGLVYASHSFEHLPEPRQALELIYASLRPGGQVVLLFPNCQSLVCRAFGSDAVSWDPPRHLTLPSARAMAAALGRIGYVDARIRTLPGRAAHYASVSRAYRRGLKGPQSWYEPIGLRERTLAAVEKVCTVAGARLGEELLVFARKGNGHP